MIVINKTIAFLNLSGGQLAVLGDNEIQTCTKLFGSPLIISKLVQICYRMSRVS